MSKYIENVYEKKEFCCGCTACEKICPQKAISMQKDEEGFLYPVVNKELCIGCNVCKNVCAFTMENHSYDDNEQKIQVYVAKHKDESVLKESTSGGVFTAISDCFLENGGYIVGCTFSEDFHKVKYTVTNDVKIRDAMRGSKYIQAEVGNVYKEVKELLEERKKVLFVGTPCHIAGLKSYLKSINTSTLTTCDIVCHGVPSPLIWEEYIEELENKLKEELVYIRFRDKKAESRHRGVWQKGNEIDLTPYMDIYNGSYITRPSCHICPYTKVQRSADITIGDFWGIEKVFPMYNSKEGASLLIIRTKKGKEIINSIEGQLIISECVIEQCLQPNLQYPTKVSNRRKIFWKKYRERGINYVLCKYTTLSLGVRIKKKLRYFLGGKGKL